MPQNIIENHEPTTSLVVTKEQASKVSIGDSVNLGIKGEVVGITRSYQETNKFDLRLKKTSVSGLSDNSADKDFSKLKERS